MVRCNTQANGMAKIANNWKTPGATVSGRHRITYKATYMLGIKIYKDRSRRLIRLSMTTYLDKILKEFKMDQSKQEFLHECKV